VHLLQSSIARFEAVQHLHLHLGELNVRSQLLQVFQLFVGIGQQTLLVLLLAQQQLGPAKMKAIGLVEHV